MSLRNAVIFLSVVKAIYGLWPALGLDLLLPAGALYLAPLFAISVESYL